jgi:multidrug efflux pump subunit AcrA (membrane-fusion protein)
MSTQLEPQAPSHPPSPVSLNPSQNGGPHPVEHPTRRPTRSRPRWVSTAIFALVVAGLVTAAAVYFLSEQAAPFHGPLHTVKKEPLKLAIVERGALESAENSDIICRVKAGKKQTATTIKWVIDNGTQVEKGQRLMELDDSALQEELNDQIIKVNKARADWIAAKNKCLITESQNKSAIETAKTALLLAEIELKKFLGDDIAKKVSPIEQRLELSKYLLGDLTGDVRKQYEENQEKAVSQILQTLSDIEGRIGIERSNQQMWLDRAAWSQRTAKKGFISRSQADSDKSRLDSAEFTLKKVQGEKDLFIRYDIEQKVTELWSKVKEAERALDRTYTEAKSKMDADVADLESKEDIYEQEHGRKYEIDDEIQKCTLYSPQHGLVVYFMAESSRYGSSSRQSIIAQGEPVYEGQKMIRIPNLSKMQVNARVHEAMVARLKGEVLRPTGFGDLLRGAFSIGRPGLDVINNMVGFNEVRDRFRKQDFEVIYAGQGATIRVDAYPSKVFNGRVKSVATVASQAEFFSSDVKVYETIVSIDESVVNLKPGMSAEVSITAEESTEPVLTIPIQSVVGSIAMGAARKCYVLEDGPPRERDIKVGRSNDRSVEVLEGLAEGEKVVLNPRPLLGEKSGMKVGTPQSRRGGDSDDAGGGPSEGKKRGKKGGDGAGFDPTKKGGGPQGFGPGGPGGPGPGFNQGGAPGDLPGGAPAGEGKRGAFKKS